MKKLVSPLLFVLLLPVPSLWAQGGEYSTLKLRSNYMSSYYLAHMPNPTPWAPSWSPDGKWIAVSMFGSIWKVEVASGVAVELTHDAKYHSNPDWSPDGKWIIYSADDDARNIQLAIVNVETGRSHELTYDGHVYMDPAFSPDGGRVAYTATNPNGR